MNRMHVARITLELRSPLGLGAGGTDDLIDSPVAVDAHGVPLIPGSSLAGVLREAVAVYWGADRAASLFGNVGTRGNDDGQASKVSVSCAQLHHSSDAVVPARPESHHLTDALVARSVELVRPHVRINGRGVADDHGLFDQQLVPTGNRFTFELAVRDRGEAEVGDEILAQLVGLLGAPSTRLGGNTRSGLGQIAVVRSTGRVFDLTVDADFSAYGAMPVNLAEPAPMLKALAPEAPPAVPGRATWSQAVRVRGGWLVGGGAAQEEDAFQVRESKTPIVPDIIPWRECGVVWREGRGEYVPVPAPVLPGSGLKGPLRHRTVFHLHGMSETPQYADDCGGREAAAALDGLHHRPLWALFGGLEPGAGDVEPMAGRLVVDEGVVRETGALTWQHHVTLDRFTGGAHRGHLFQDAFYWGGAFDLQVHIDDPSGEVPVALRSALQAALDDLVEGRLAVGGGTGRGHGRLERVGDEDPWSDGGAWVRGEEAAT